MSELKDRLTRAADDTGHPLHTDLADLLDRARAARRRRHVVPALAAACVVLAASLTAVDLGPGHRSTVGTQAPPVSSGVPVPVASPSGSVSPTRRAEAVLTDAEVVRRCLPQLTTYDGLPRWRGGSANPPPAPVPSDGWTVVNAARSTYRSGDVVAIAEKTSDIGLGRLCLIPDAGREDTPVPLSAFEPTTDQVALIGQVCSESESTGRPVPDLRGATVVTAQRSAHVLDAVLQLRGQRFGCTIPSMELSDRVSFETRGPLPADPTLDAGQFGFSSLGPKADPVSAAYWGNGVLPTTVATLSWHVPGQPAVIVPVHDGAFAFSVELPLTQLLRPSYTLLDAQGRLLYSGSL